MRTLIQSAARSQVGNRLTQEWIDVQPMKHILFQFEDMRKMMKTIGKFQGSGRMMPNMPFMK